jgi:alpha-tubulin suppressor-like RCC1 family protein
MAWTRALAIGGSFLAAVVAAGCKDVTPPSTEITVTAVSPAIGSLAGGTSVTITGTNFIDVTGVTFGGSALGSLVVVSPTEITGTTPAASSSGAKDVVVTSSSQGSSTCSGCFTYEAGALSVTAVSPPSGALAGGTSVTITGTNFVNVTSVTIGGTELGNRTVVSPTQITGTTPAATSPGAMDVVVTSATQGSSTCRGCFGYESSNVVAAVLDAGSSNTCALTSSGAAYCWGDGRTTPVAVAEGWTFSALATSGSHTCALATSGAAYCWGNNVAGQLGDGSTTNSATPVAVVGGHSFIALLAGRNAYTCGLTSAGTAYCWGYNGYGQLGNGTTGPEMCPGTPGTAGPFPCSTRPVAVVGGHDVITLATGGSGYADEGQTCGVTSSGTAYCWGPDHGSTPVAVAAGFSFSALTVGGDHACGLTSSGTAYCWGYNGDGQLGDGSTTHSATPVAVAGGLSFSALSAGLWHTCGLMSAGAIYCWGFNGYGQLGNGPGGSRDACAEHWGSVRGPCSTTPVAVVGGLSFSALAAGTYHTCARTSAEAAVYCWGLNSNGQLGDGQNWWAPAPVVGDLSFSALGASYDHTCGLTSSGAAYCWGNNNAGQLGDGSTATRATPVAVVGGHDFIAVVADGIHGGHTCALTRAGAAYCWGDNSHGELGDGSGGGPELCPSVYSYGVDYPCSKMPVAVAGGLSFSALNAAYAHTCALTSAGVAYCWGYNYDGQLGDGSTTSRTTPVAVKGGLTFTALAADFYHTCALTSTGAAYCWGRNEYGRLGDGSTTNSATPVAVAGGLTFSSLGAGINRTCGLTKSGTAYCWGQGYASTPVAVSGGLSFTTLDAQSWSTCGLTTSGAVYCWAGGRVPVATAEGWSFIALAVGGDHICGLTSSQAAYCWGRNNYGQLGRGVFDYSTVPVAVAPFGASASASVGVMPAGSMRPSEPFFGERCTPPVAGRQPSAERGERDLRCGARP